MELGSACHCFWCFCCVLQVQIDATIEKVREEDFQSMLADCNISLEEMEGVVQPIIESCTKDAISVCISPMNDKYVVSWIRVFIVLPFKQHKGVDHFL